MQSSSSPVPRHVAFILDGNRRFAKRLMLKPWKGHEWGADKVGKVLDWLREYGVREATFYAFSSENFNRPKEEFVYLMTVFRSTFDKLLDDPRLAELKIRVTFLGRIWMFPPDIQERMHKIMDKTKDYDGYLVNFAMAYGGRLEVIDAAKRIAEQVKAGALAIDQINEETFAQELYMADEPDLIIRTGGEKRMSNFLSFQAAYSELIFLDKMWPEFEKEDLIACLEEYKQRQRRFGK